MSLRTIFLMVRGTYQAGLAMRLARQDLKKLADAQREIIRRTEEMMRAANQWLFAGAAFLTFGGMITKSILGLMEASTAGRIALGLFSMRVQRSMRRISEAITPVMTVILNFVAGILELVAANPILTAIAAGFILIAGPVLMVSGALLLVSGGIKIVTAAFTLMAQRTLFASAAVNKMQVSLMRYYPAGEVAKNTTLGLTVSMRGLAVATAAAFAVFFAVYTIVSFVAQEFGLLPAIIVAITAAMIPLAIIAWKTAGAMSVLSFGAAALAGTAAIIGAVKASTISTFGAGTAFVRKGGMAMVHGGEEIKSARESTFTSKIEKETHREVSMGGPARSYTDVRVQIDTINTRARIEDLDEKLRAGLKEGLDNKV